MYLGRSRAHSIAGYILQVMPVQRGAANFLQSRAAELQSRILELVADKVFFYLPQPSHAEQRFRLQDTCLHVRSIGSLCACVNFAECSSAGWMQVAMDPFVKVRKMIKARSLSG